MSEIAIPLINIGNSRRFKYVDANDLTIHDQMHSTATYTVIKGDIDISKLSSSVWISGSANGYPSIDSEFVLIPTDSHAIWQMEKISLEEKETCTMRYLNKCRSLFCSQKPIVKFVLLPFFVILIFTAVFSGIFVSKLVNAALGSVIIKDQSSAFFWSFIFLGWFITALVGVIDTLKRMCENEKKWNK